MLGGKERSIVNTGGAGPLSLIDVRRLLNRGFRMEMCAWGEKKGTNGGGLTRGGGLERSAIRMDEQVDVRKN